jgi:glycolate oxidase
VNPESLADARDALRLLLGPAAIGDSAAPLVARPADEEQIVAILRLADERGVPVYPVGGAPYPARPGLFLDLARLDTILEMAPDDTLAVVGAGLPVARLAEAAAAVGLDYPSALTAAAGATVGGALARGGERSPGWGPDRELALGVRIALADGRLVDVGSRAIKNQTGYNLTQLVVGSRGALGVIVSATLRLWPRLSARQTILVGCPSLPTAARAAVDLAMLPLPPAAVELFDATALQTLARSTPGARALTSHLAEHPAAALLALVAGVDQAEVEARASTLCARLSASGASAAVLDEEASQLAWAARRALPSRLAAHWPDQATVEVGLPLDRVESFAARAEKRASDIGICLFGAAGLGALTLALYDATPGRRLELARELVSATRTEGGQVRDAVGLGLEYDDWLRLVVAPPTAEVMRRVRSALDPRGMLQPART